MANAWKVTLNTPTTPNPVTGTHLNPLPTNYLGVPAFELIDSQTIRLLVSDIVLETPVVVNGEALLSVKKTDDTIYLTRGGWFVTDTVKEYATYTRTIIPTSTIARIENESITPPVPPTPLTCAIEYPTGATTITASPFTIRVSAESLAVTAIIRMKNASGAQIFQNTISTRVNNEFQHIVSGTLPPNGTYTVEASVVDTTGLRTGTATSVSFTIAVSVLTVVNLTPATVALATGASAVLTVQLSANAPSNTTVTLSTDQPSYLTVPANAVVATGTNTKSFTITAQNTPSAPIVTATLNAVSKISTITITSPQPPPSGTVPDLATFETVMLKYGDFQGHSYRQPGWNGDPEGRDAYYDAAHCLYQIWDYFGQPTFDGGINPGVLPASTPWNTDGHAAAIYWRDSDNMGNISGGSTQGHLQYTAGLRKHWEKTGQAASKNAITHVVSTGWASGLFRDYGGSYVSMRGNALSIMSWIDSDLVGNAHSVNMEDLLTQLMTVMFEQMFGTYSGVYRMAINAPHYDWDGVTKMGIVSFQVGLCLEAMIRYWEQVSHDSRIPIYVKMALDGLWELCWRGGGADKGFVYEMPFQQIIYPDLTALIVPAYAWYWRLSGDTTYRDRADQAWLGMVRCSYCTNIGWYLGESECLAMQGGASFEGGKVFNQGHRWSLAYVKWRQGLTYTGW